MRRIISMLLLAVLVLALPASCRKQAVVTIEANTIDAPSSGLTRALGINTNYPWDAVASDSWIVLHNTTGNPGMATGGSGDVLTGILLALCAQGFSQYDATRLGVFIHGLAGDIAADRLGQISMAATDITVFLPEAWKRTAERR